MTAPRLLLPFVLSGVPLACKAAPETAPPGASAPTAATVVSPPPAGPTVPTEATAAPVASPGAHVYADSTTSIQVAPGEHFSVALPANITVPMKWRLEPPPDPNLLGAGEDKYVEAPPADCATCTGYGGTRIFPFTAIGQGKVTLRFALRPLTDPHGTSQKDVTIAVEIK